MSRHPLRKIGADSHQKVLEKVVKYIRDGNHPGIACEAAGLSYIQFKRYMRIGDGLPTDWQPAPADIPLIEDFSQKVKVAQARAEVDIVTNIKAKAMTDPEIGLKFLARRYPGRWGDKSLQIKVDWNVEAARSLEAGEVTWEILEQEFGRELLEREVVPLLKSPQTVIIESKAVEVPIPAPKVKEMGL